MPSGATDALSLEAFASYLAADASDGSELLLIVAHPDDETVGFGGQLAKLQRTRMLHVTDGAPRDLRDAVAHGFSSAADYAKARQRELAAALAEAGLPANAAENLGIADQQAARQMPIIARRIAAVLAERRPRFRADAPL